MPNYVNVTWAVEVGSGFTCSVYFVDKLSSSDLMEELKKKGKRNSDYTRAVIKDKLSDKDNEIATTSCKVSDRDRSRDHYIAKILGLGSIF